MSVRALLTAISVLAMLGCGGASPAPETAATSETLAAENLTNGTETAETVVAQAPTQYVIEVTTLRHNENMTPEEFAAADADVSVRYTRVQPGYIQRHSGRSSDGEWLVLVLWETNEDAVASMERFMGEPSVADFAGAIDGPSMRMTRYAGVGVIRNVETAPVVEVTTFALAAGVDQATFAARDAEVEAAFTHAQPGFIQRTSGFDEDGKWAVVVLWEDMASAESSMQRFMSDPSVADYARMIDASQMTMERFSRQ